MFDKIKEICTKKIMQNHFDKKDMIGIALIALSVLLYLNGFRRRDYNLQLLSMYIVAIGIILSTKKKTVFLIIFYIAFFIFLVNRPFLDFLSGVEWWKAYYLEFVNEALFMIYISIIGIGIGFNYGLEFLNHFKKNTFKVSSKPGKTIVTVDRSTRNFVFIIILVVYLITYLALIFTEIDKLIFMSGRLYEEFYLLYKPSYPALVSIVSRMNFYFFAALLAFFPNKKFSFIILSLNIISSIPMLLIGQRGGFVLGLLYALVYYLVRHFSNSNEIWFGKMEKTMLFLGIPILIISMGFINDLRHGYGFTFDGIIDSFKSFLYKQGVTFNTHMKAVEQTENIYNLTGSTNYLFGEIIGPVKNNPLFKNIFNLPNIPSGNSVEKAINGYWFSHILAYQVHPWYLKGFGYGTSYVSEAFHTYGNLGVILTNLFIGYSLNLITLWSKKKYQFRLTLLIVINYIFYVPRQPFASLFSFLIKPYFIIVVLFIYLVSKYSKKEFLIKTKVLNRTKKIITYSGLS